MTRREAGEDLYRQKFDEYGLSGRFTFLHREWSIDHDKRFWCRCNTCGAEFLSWNEVFRGRQKHLLCPACGAASDGDDVKARSPKVDEAMAFYAEGHSARETAEKFGFSRTDICNFAKDRGVSNGRSFRACGEEAGKALKADAVRRLTDHLNSHGFEYIGGYENKEGRALIRCMNCGAEYERSVDHLRKGNVICVECQKRETRRRQEKRRRENAERSEARRLERERIRSLRQQEPKDYYTAAHEAFLNRSGVCGICGKAYTVREYVESCGLKQARDNGVCSEECRRAKLKAAVKASHKGRQDSHRHRARKYGVDYDPSVTLKRLIERDGLRCAICGEMCDLNDRSWSEYSGPMYPSIDHIVPMSKGGGHTWENVQIAHIKCNSLKGNALEVNA